MKLALTLAAILAQDEIEDDYVFSSEQGEVRINTTYVLPNIGDSPAAVQFSAETFDQLRELLKEWGVADWAGESEGRCIISYEPHMAQWIAIAVPLDPETYFWNNDGDPERIAKKVEGLLSC